MNEFHRIPLAEDNPRDVELTLAALAPHHLANEFVTVRDGTEALDYLYCRGVFTDRTRRSNVRDLLGPGQLLAERGQVG